MTSTGQTVISAKPAPQGAKRSASPSQGSATKAAKIDASQSSASHCLATKPAKIDAAVAISICGQHYTSLSWFLSKENPSPSLCKRARENCGDNALVLVGGHTRSVKFFAKVPGTSRLQPLCVVGGQARQNFPGAQPVNTEVSGVKIKKAEQPVTARLSQVLWLVKDLEQDFRH